MTLQKALFLDLDSTLITTQTGRTFPIHYKDWKLIDDTVDLIEIFYKKGYKIIIVSNQGGIEEGYIEESIFIRKIETICKFIEAGLRMKDNSIAYFYHSSIEGYNRKPNPGMGWLAKRDFPKINFQESIMVGDSFSDMEFGWQLGTKTVFIEGKEEETERTRQIPVDGRFENLWQLAEYLESPQADLITF